MVCVSSCLLASGFIGGMLLTMMVPEDADFFEKYHGILNSNQLKAYNEIKSERMSLHLQGLFFGVLLAIAVVYNLGFRSTTKKVCLFILIALATNYFYYILSPKSQYMIDYLQTPEQMSTWLVVYRQMQMRYYWGFFLAIMGYLFLAHGIFGKI